MMQPLTRDDLFTLERYAEVRPEFRTRVLAHKRARRLRLSANAALYFEDRLTIQYQIQEMLRVERIFERAGIDEELAAYNPLIPDGTNLKATFMLEYEDVDERQRRLAELRGIERTVWVAAGDLAPAFAIADEDLDRESDDKTSAVHFLRFELDAPTRAALAEGAPMRAGIDHPGSRVALEVPAEVRASLVADLD